MTEKRKSALAARRTHTPYDLFRTFVPTTGNTAHDYSNTIELWDAAPKYSVSARKQAMLRDEKGNLVPCKIPFNYNPKGYPNAIPCLLEIQPASIEVEPGVYKQFFPSTDEELVEEVLRKIFTDQRYGAHAPAASESWVRFTLRAIQRELRERGKTRSIPEVRRSIEILSRAVLVLHVKDNARLTYRNPILTNVTDVSREQYLNDPAALWQASLPLLISIAINKLAYRQFNYATLMALGNSLQRWLFKRFSHYYTYATYIKPYCFSFSFVELNSGLLHHSRKERNRKSIEAALQSLSTSQQDPCNPGQNRPPVLMKWEQEVIYKKKGRGQAIADVKYTVWPSVYLVADIKAANARLRDDRNRLQIVPSDDRSPFIDRPPAVQAPLDARAAKKGGW
ncbi:MAG: hypothetical protein WA970_17830 [Gammaproteobacteria bacterium]